MVESGQTAKPVGRAQLIAVALVAVVLFAGYQVQKHREGPRPTRRNAGVVVFSASSPETRLATLQLSGRPDHVDSTVKRFAGLLDILGGDCPADTRAGLADLTVRSVRSLRRQGIAATPTEVLGGVLGFVDIGATAHCTRFFARYVARRQSQGN